jgi:hypothetical protein
MEALLGCGVGCDDGARGSWVSSAAVFANVPVALTWSRILLVAGVAGVACCAAFARLGAFFSFFASTSVSLAVVFAGVFFIEGVFACTTGVSTCSAATFFGRPRFLVALVDIGESIGVGTI